MDSSVDSPRPAPAEPLLLVSDTSTEAERLIASLRVRGYKVRDVPLMLLPGRVEAQKPNLVVCGGQAAGVVKILARSRAGAHGSTVPVIVLGADAEIVEALSPHVPDIASRAFPRPIDIYTVLQRIEEIVGSPDRVETGSSRSLASLPRLHSPIIRPSTPAERRVSQSPSVPADRRLIPTPRPRRGVSAPSPADQNPEPSSPESSEVLQSSRRLPSLPPSVGEERVPHVAASIPAARMSPELEALLSDADRRFLGRSASAHPAPISTSRLSPEEELDAVLPPDILAALEEGLGQDEDDDTSNPDLSTRERSETGSKGVQGSTTRAGLTELGSRTSHTGPGDEDTGAGRHGHRSWAARSALGSSPPISLRERSLSQTNAIVPSPGSVPYTTHSIPVQAPDSTVPPRTRAEPRILQPTTPPSARDDAPTSEPATPRSVRARSPSLTPMDGYSMEDQRREELSTAPPRAASHSLTIDGLPSPRFEEGGDDLARASDPGATASPSLSVEMEPQRTAKPLARIPLTPIPLAPLLAHDNARGRDGRLANDPGTGVDVTSEPLPAPSAPQAVARPSIPATLVAGDVIRALAKCISSRFSGALVVEDDEGIRRVVLREGDFVTVASGVEGESLVSFLVQRGDLTRDALRLERKLPQFGRHAGAALIAHGYLRQDELWPVLRAHAEWILGRTLQVLRAAASLEEELPPRLQSEPTVFGGSTGAETLIEIVRRTVPPEAALARLGGVRVRVALGPTAQLLGECALVPQEEQAVRQGVGSKLQELLARVPEAHFAAAILGLVELGVLELMAGTDAGSTPPDGPPPRDRLDDDAVRARVGRRRALVEQGDYFSLLGIGHDATGYEVRHAYLTLRRELDPGKLLTASTADLREDLDTVLEVLDEAHDILRDAARRERYRRALDARPG